MPLVPPTLPDVLRRIPLWSRGGRKALYVTRPRFLMQVFSSYGYTISRAQASYLMNAKAPLSKEVILLLMRASRGRLRGDYLLRLGPTTWPNHQAKREKAARPPPGA